MSTPDPSVHRGLPFVPSGIIGLSAMPFAMLALVTWWESRQAVLFGDTRWYAVGYENLMSPGPLYDPTTLRPHTLAGPPFWDQPPSLAPLTVLLGLEHGVLLFGGIMSLSVLLGLAMIWPPVGGGGTLLLVPALLVWEPVTSALVWANVNALVFLLLIIAYRYPRWAGAAIGLAAALKLIPILGIAWLAGRRDWRGVATAIAIPCALTATVVVIKGPDTIGDFITMRANQGAVADGSVATLLSDVAPALGLATAAYWRGSFSLSVLAMTAAVPVLYLHYLIWLLIPSVIVWIPWVSGKLNSRTPLDWLPTWPPPRRYQSGR